MKKVMVHNVRFIDVMKNATFQIITRYFIQNRCLSPFQWFMLEYLLDKETLSATLEETVLGRRYSGNASRVKAFQYVNMKVEVQFNRLRESLSISRSGWRYLKSRKRNASSPNVQFDRGKFEGIHEMGVRGTLLEFFRGGLFSIRSDFRSIKRDLQFVKRDLFFLWNTYLSEERGPPSPSRLLVSMSTDKP